MLISQLEAKLSEIKRLYGDLSIETIVSITALPEAYFAPALIELSPAHLKDENRDICIIKVS